MEVRKKIQLFHRLRWCGVLFGVIMYLATFTAFGDMLAMLLAVAATVGFFIICSLEGTRTMCQFVADDLKQAVQEAGHSRCIVEIKSFNAGLITRVYLIRAYEREAILNRVIIQRINQSWYRKKIWVTQILGMEDESELQQAHEFLDEALIEDIRRKRAESWKDSDDRDKNGKW